MAVARAIEPTDIPAASIGIIMYCAAPAYTKILAATASHHAPPAWTNKNPNTVPKGIYPIATGRVRAKAETVGFLDCVTRSGEGADMRGTKIRKYRYCDRPKSTISLAVCAILG